MLRGSCLCGAIAYSAAGPIESASHCYCTMCQKQHGAAAGTYANIARADLRSEETPEHIAVTLGTLDQPFTDRVEIELHTGSKPAWLPHGY